MIRDLRLMMFGAGLYASGVLIDGLGPVRWADVRFFACAWVVLAAVDIVVGVRSYRRYRADRVTAAKRDAR